MWSPPAIPYNGNILIFYAFPATHIQFIAWTIIWFELFENCILSFGLLQAKLHLLYLSVCIFCVRIGETLWIRGAFSFLVHCWLFRYRCCYNKIYFVFSILNSNLLISISNFPAAFHIVNFSDLKGYRKSRTLHCLTTTYKRPELVFTIFFFYQFPLFYLLL